jgi:hypothetical protein
VSTGARRAPRARYLPIAEHGLSTPFRKHCKFDGFDEPIDGVGVIPLLHLNASQRTALRGPIRLHTILGSSTDCCAQPPQADYPAALRLGQATRSAVAKLDGRKGLARSTSGIRPLPEAVAYYDPHPFNPEGRCDEQSDDRIRPPPVKARV